MATKYTWVTLKKLVKEWLKDGFSVNHGGISVGPSPAPHLFIDENGIQSVSGIQGHKDANITMSQNGIDINGSTVNINGSPFPFKRPLKLLWGGYYLYTKDSEGKLHYKESSAWWGGGSGGAELKERVEDQVNGILLHFQGCDATQEPDSSGHKSVKTLNGTDHHYYFVPKEIVACRKTPIKISPDDNPEKLKEGTMDLSPEFSVFAFSHIGKDGYGVSTGIRFMVKYFYIKEKEILNEETKETELKDVIYGYEANDDNEVQYGNMTLDNHHWALTEIYGV